MCDPFPSLFEDSLIFYLHFEAMYHCRVVAVSQANQLNTIGFGLATINMEYHIIFVVTVNIFTH